MDLFPNWDLYSQQDNDEVEHELFETDHVEHKQVNCEDNNGRFQCHKSENLPGQTRTAIPDGQDIGNRIISFNFKQTHVLFFVYDLAKSLIKFKPIKTTFQKRRFR